MEDLTPKKESDVESDSSMDNREDTPELKDIRIQRDKSFYGERIITMSLPGESCQTATYWECPWFIADMNYEILGVEFTYSNEATASTTVDLIIANDGTSIASGTRFLGSSNAFSFNDATLREDVQIGTIPTDRTSRLLKEGQKLGMYYFGGSGLTSSRSAHMTVRLRAIK